MPDTDRKPLLVSITWHPEAKNQAMELARLIADIEDRPQNRSGFLFCPRFDCLVDPLVEMAVREKFPDTKILRLQNRSTGWPKGPNACAHEVYSHFYRMSHVRGPEQWDYCAILMMEPDCVPLTQDWIAQLQEEWYVCNWPWPGGNHQQVLGCWSTRDDPGHCPTPHMNGGTCMIGPEFLSAYSAFTRTTFGAWDTTHSRAMMQYGRPSKLIYSDYAVGGPTGRPFLGIDDLYQTRRPGKSNPLVGEELHPVFLHGCLLYT